MIYIGILKLINLKIKLKINNIYINIQITIFLLIINNIKIKQPEVFIRMVKHQINLKLEVNIITKITLKISKMFNKNQ